MAPTRAVATVTAEPRYAHGAIAVVVPIRSFDLGKSRLSGVVGEADRRRLARALAGRTLSAAAELPAWVVTEDPGVAQWSIDRGAGVIDPCTAGLNPCVTAAHDLLRERDLHRLVIAHADLPLARTLVPVVGTGDEVVIAPDRRGDGTNVMSLPADGHFGFQYGISSASRHVTEARGRNRPVRVVRDDRLAWDVDRPIDLPDGWRAMLDESHDPDNNGDENRGAP